MTLTPDKYDEDRYSYTAEEFEAMTAPRAASANPYPFYELTGSTGAKNNRNMMGVWFYEDPELDADTYVTRYREINALSGVVGQQPPVQMPTGLGKFRFEGYDRILREFVEDPILEFINPSDRYPRIDDRTGLAVPTVSSMIAMPIVRLDTDRDGNWSTNRTYRSAVLRMTKTNYDSLVSKIGAFREGAGKKFTFAGQGPFLLTRISDTNAKSSEVSITRGIDWDGPIEWPERIDVNALLRAQRKEAVEFIENAVLELNVPMPAWATAEPERDLTAAVEEIYSESEPSKYAGVSEMRLRKKLMAIGVNVPVSIPRPELDALCVEHNI